MRLILSIIIYLSLANLVVAQNSDCEFIIQNITCGYEASCNLSAKGNDFLNIYNCTTNSRVPSLGEDAFFSFQIDSPQTVHLELGATCQKSLSIFDNDDFDTSTPIGYFNLDPEESNKQSAALTVDLEVGQYYIIVDEFVRSNCSDFSLSFTCQDYYASLCEIGGKLLDCGLTYREQISALTVVPESPVCSPKPIFTKFDYACPINNFQGFPPYISGRDVFLYYHSSSGDLNITLNTNELFILLMTSNCEESDVCIASRVGALDMNNLPEGFYYIVIDNPMPRFRTYTIKVLSEGCDCQRDFDPLVCDTDPLIKGDVTGMGNDISTTINTYNNSGFDCYTNSSYDGEDIAYKFQICTPQIVTFQLVPEQGGMALTLVDQQFNCLALAESTGRDDSADIKELALTSGLYYLIIDKDLMGGNGKFSLLHDCLTSNTNSNLIDTSCGIIECYTTNSTGGAVGAGDGEIINPVTEPDIRTPDIVNDIDSTNYRHTIILSENIAVKGLLDLNNQPIILGSTDMLSFYALNRVESPGPLSSLQAQYKLTGKVVPQRGTELSFNVFGDDPTSGLDEGFQEGDQFIIHLQICRLDCKTYQEVVATFDPISSGITAQNIFQNGGKSKLRSLEIPSSTNSNEDSPTIFSIDPLEIKGVTSVGDTIDFLVNANRQWTIRAIPSWVHLVDQADDFGRGPKNIEFTFDTNDENLERTDSILLISGMDSIYFKITQQPDMIVSINDLEILSSLTTIYPNPTSDHLFIQLHSSFSKEIEVSLYGPTGQKISNTQMDYFDAPLKIDCSELENGLYFLVLKTDSYLLSEKVLISK